MNVSRMWTWCVRSRANGRGLLSAVVAVWLGGLAILTAANGDLDLSFGDGGRVLTDFGGTDDKGRAVAIDGNGRIVVAGWAGSVVTDLDLRLARYNPDGSLDTTFGTDGIVTSSRFAAEDLAIDRDGSIVVFGWRWLGSEFGTSVFRFLEDGTPDLNFGVGGRVDTPCNKTTFSGGVVIDDNGRVLVAGSTDANGQDGFCLARYNGNGSPDITFGAGGLAIARFSNAAFGWDLTISPRGDIVVAGSVIEPAQPTNDQHVALARFTNSGFLDPSFGNLGTVEGTKFAANDGAFAVVVDDQERAVVVGHATPAANRSDMLVARYTANGTPDSDFDGDGWVVVEMSGQTVRYSMAVGVDIDREGRIVATGHVSDTLGTDFAVIRLTGDGSLDTSFGVGGKTRNDFGGASVAAGVAIDANDLIVVAGTSSKFGTTIGDFGVARLQSRSYTFTGFSGPIDNAPAVNVIKAGRAVPVQFSLNGDQSLDVLAAGSPTSHPIACESSASIEVLEEALTAATSDLSYDPTTDQYTYVWKTDKAWANTCRQLVLTLNDGSPHVANFQFAR